MANETATSVTLLSEQAAEEIRALLARRRVSGRKLAERLGVSASWVSYRLTGVQEIGLNDLQRIAQVLNVEVVDLLPPSREGTVVTVGGRTRQTTAPNFRPPVRTSPIGSPRALAPRQSTRRPVVLAPSRS